MNMYSIAFKYYNESNIEWLLGVVFNRLTYVYLSVILKYAQLQRGQHITLLQISKAVLTWHTIC